MKNILICLALSGVVAMATPQKVDNIDEISRAIDMCEQGISPKCIQVAKFYENDENFKKANEYYQKSTKWFYVKGYYAYGSFLKRTMKDLELAKKYLATACDTNMIDACYEAGEIEYGDGNLEKARTFFRKSKYGTFELESHRLLGKIEENIGNKDSKFNAYSEGCMVGDYDSCVKAIDLIDVAGIKWLHYNMACKMKPESELCKSSRFLPISK